MRRKNSFLSAEEERELVQAIQQAEKQTSGEIRIHIHNRSEENIPMLDAAQKIFFQLGMDQTKKRNGILFYVAVNQRSLTILGDEGIDKIVPPRFWDEIKDRVIENFKAQKYAQGLIEGIAMAGETLKKHFPYEKDDINELQDDISKD